MTLPVLTATVWTYTGLDGSVPRHRQGRQVVLAGCREAVVVVRSLGWLRLRAGSLGLVSGHESSPPLLSGTLGGQPGAPGQSGRRGSLIGLTSDAELPGERQSSMQWSVS